MIVNLRHVAICVSDIRHAIRFYTGLGAELKSEDCQISTCKLQLRDGSRIELMEFKNPHPISIDSANTMAFLGLHHIGFTVLDINDSIRIMKSLGGRLISPPQSVPKGHSKHAVQAMHCYASDPFGNIIHLAQDTL
jgi:catechol 2,3-dioxygenase-like lactoylglutathione lyase family enzyme